MELGEKIRARRRDLKMTQSELAGEFVTRNMLSQIESGRATPSLSTLRYLAERLLLPVGYFFSEEDGFFYRKQQVFPRLRDLFHAGSYAECLRLFEREIGACDDELGYMMAVCSYYCGEKAWKNGNLESALAYLASALDYAEETVYPTDWIKAGCRLMMPIALNVQAPLLEFNQNAYIDSLREAGCLDVFCYLTEREDYTFENTVYADHLAARRLLKGGHYVEALAALRRIEEQKGTEAVTAFLLFRLYADMEVCCRELGDYEGAYRYAGKRLTLLSAFAS